MECPNFTSTVNDTALYTNRTYTLSSGSFCVIMVNATSEVARVIFDDTSFLGVELDNYLPGDVITVEREAKEILIYNGAMSGSVTFVLSYSGAYSALSAGIVGAVAMMSLF